MNWKHPTSVSRRNQRRNDALCQKLTWRGVPIAYNQAILSTIDIDRDELFKITNYSSK